MAVTHRGVGTGGPERGTVLHAALGRMRRATGLPVTFGGAVSGGCKSVRITELAGTCSGALRSLVITAGNGLGGRVLVTVRPDSVDDYAADSQISHEYDKPVTAEGLRAIAAVPVVAGGSVTGVLYGGIREPLPLGGRVLEAMSQIAAQAGIELTVQSEVERRLADLETAAITSAAREAPATPEWEQVRQAHAELRSIARQVADPDLRRRLEGVCGRLTRPYSQHAAGSPPVAPRVGRARPARGGLR